MFIFLKTAWIPFEVQCKLGCGIVFEEDRTKDWLLANSMYSASTSANNTNNETVCKYCGDNAKQCETSDNKCERDYPDSNEKKEVKVKVHYQKDCITSSRCNSCSVIL